MASKFETLQNEVSKMEYGLDNLTSRIDNVLDQARINAYDTCYVEKSRPISDESEVALETIGCILAYSDDKEVCAWFIARGIEF